MLARGIDLFALAPRSPAYGKGFSTMTADHAVTHQKEQACISPTAKCSLDDHDSLGGWTRRRALRDRSLGGRCATEPGPRRASVRQDRRFDGGAGSRVAPTRGSHGEPEELRGGRMDALTMTMLDN